MKKTIDYIFTLIVLFLFLLVFTVILPHGCTHPESTVRVLEEQGYTNVQITGWRPLSVDKNDIYSTGFTAISPKGNEVTGVVTSGLFKGNTVRLD